MNTVFAHVFYLTFILTNGSCHFFLWTRSKFTCYLVLQSSTTLEKLIFPDFFGIGHRWWERGTELLTQPHISHLHMHTWKNAHITDTNQAKDSLHSLQNIFSPLKQHAPCPLCLQEANKMKTKN